MAARRADLVRPDRNVRHDGHREGWRDRCDPGAVPVVVRPCSAEDFVRLLHDSHPGRLAHHRGRYALQGRGEGIYLLAVDGDRVLGRVTVTRWSKYPRVCAVLGGGAEMNALTADPPGRGVGSTLIAAAEEVALSWGANTIGLAVDTDNAGAHRLYRRRGYADWGRGTVVDEWAETDADGYVLVAHRDRCWYLTKRLPGVASPP